MNFSKVLLILSFLFSSYTIAQSKMLDDKALSHQVAQAGLAIDTDYIPDLTEFEYVDSYLLDMAYINVGGHGNDGSQDKAFYTDRLDNIGVHVSLAKQGNGNTYGFSRLRELAKIYLANGNKVSVEEFEALASGEDSSRSLKVDGEREYQEGDLIIHYGFQDAWEKDGGFDVFSQGAGVSGLDFTNVSASQAEDLMSRAVDFKYSINEIGILNHNILSAGVTQSAAQETGSFASNDGAVDTSTRLMSEFSIEGYLGPHDLHIREYDPQNSDAPNATNNIGITWNSYFTVTDLDVYLDVKGMRIADLQVHNNRGDLSGLNLNSEDGSEGTSSFGFAHAQREIYTLDEPVLNVLGNSESSDKKEKREAIAFNTRFKGDIDIGHVSFGDSDISIGKYFITDMYFNNKLTISSRE